MSRAAFRTPKPRKPRRHDPHTLVASVFDRDALTRICEMPEGDFASTYDLSTVSVPQEAPADVYYFRDNGARVLAVAHLDTVGEAHTRRCQFLDTEGGEVVFSRALDDRLGAYVILELLPKLGITYDWLLTVGEETGESTAQFFTARKDYDWVIEFDRGGTDVVMYQYDDIDTRELVHASGARVDQGSFSDIAYLEHLNVKAFNWGVGYEDYHGPRAHAFLNDTFDMVVKYLAFHHANAGTRLPHETLDPFTLDASSCEHEDHEGADDGLYCDETDHVPYHSTVYSWWNNDTPSGRYR